MDTFGERLQHVMRVKKIKSITLAEKMKRDRSQISRWRRAKKPPNELIIDEMSEITGCNPWWLEKGEGKAFPKPSTAGHTMSGISNSDGNVQAGGDVMYTMTRSGRKTGNKGNLDDDILNKIRAWLDETERTQPGYRAWFRIEIQHRFPEFAEWIAKDSKKQIT